MNNTEVRHMHTRNSARAFGVNITNLPMEPSKEAKKPKEKKPVSTLATVWPQSNPHVHPYIEEISSHTRNSEHECYILENFMPWHPEIDTNMREMLMGWLVEVQSKLCFNPHTLYLAILIIDKYCCQRAIAKRHYQLLGISAMFVAAKYEEVKTPRLKHYYRICEGQYQIDQILDMESQILLALNFNIKSTTSRWHLEQYLEQAGLESQNRQLCLYILDLSLIQYNCCLIRPTLLGWGIVLFVVKARKLRDISERQICQNFQLGANDLKESFNFVAELYNSRRDKKFKSVNSKYLEEIGHIVA